MAPWPPWRLPGCSAPSPVTGYGDRARLATLWFGAGTAAILFSGRLTFALGVAIGLGALLALQRRRPLLAAVLAVLTVCGSPVAGLFLALAGVAVMLAGDRRGGALVALPALAALGALSLAFPTGGEEPFVFSAFIGVPLFAAGAPCSCCRPSERVLRWGVAVYAIAAVAAFAAGQPGGWEHGPPGGAGRRGRCWPWGSRAAGRWRLRPSPCPCSTGNGWRPSATCPRRPGTRRCTPPTTSRCSPSSSGAREERPRGSRSRRPRNRWEADYVAPRFPLARGWLRQLESDDLDLFTEGNLTAAAVSVLARSTDGVSYVAVADAEARLPGQRTRRP